MGRLDINRSGEMEVFARVVELGGFSAAARRMGITPSAVSKLVARLERRLGARLLNRSTRQLRLTPEGEAFYGRCRAVLAAIAEAEREVAAGAVPRGRVRVNSNVPFGLHWLMPLVPDFLARYPEITLDIVTTDTVIDLIDERADVAIRVGPMRASPLVARKLGESRMAVVASPDYLARNGVPTTLAELERHNRIAFNFTRLVAGWPFRDPSGAIVTVPPAGNVLVSDGEGARRLALAGAGLARLSHFHIGPDLAAGRLVEVLADLNPGDTETIHAVFVGQGAKLPARVRVFLDYLAVHARVS